MTLLTDGDARSGHRADTLQRGRGGYRASFTLSPVRVSSGAVLDVTYSAAGRSWTADDIARVSLERVLGSTKLPGPEHIGLPASIDWDGVVRCAGGIPALVQVLGDLVVTERAIVYGIFARLHLVEANLVGLPRAVELRVRGSRPQPYGVQTAPLELTVRVTLTGGQ